LSDFLIEKICKADEKINSDTLKPVTRNALGVTGYEFEAVLHIYVSRIAQLRYNSTQNKRGKKNPLPLL